MTTASVEAENRDTQCFQRALFEWNVEHTGWDNPERHLPWWKLSMREKSDVMQRAQRLKDEARNA